MRIPAWLVFFVFLLPLAIVPLLLFADLAIHGLTRLHLSLNVALVLLFGMFAGGFVNIPIKRIRRATQTIDHPLTIVGLSELWPHLQRVRDEAIVAVNVGGCLIPLGIALYELGHLASRGPEALLGVSSAIVINTVVCCLIARPVPNVGIAMPAFVSPLVSAGLALFLTPDFAPPVAFVAGVVGPLVGADLLHLSDINKIDAGVISIGGAGTFDGTVLSGIVAAYLT